MPATSKNARLSYIAQLENAKIVPRLVVAQVTPLKAFYPADAYHQTYRSLHPNHPYIVYNDAPKVDHLLRQFPNLYMTK